MTSNTVGKRGLMLLNNLFRAGYGVGALLAPTQFAKLQLAPDTESAWPEGPDLALETFNSTLGPKGYTYERDVNGLVVPFKPRGMRIPWTCPAGGYPLNVSLTLTFRDSSSSVASYRVPCPGQ